MEIVLFGEKLAPDVRLQPQVTVEQWAVLQEAEDSYLVCGLLVGTRLVRVSTPLKRFEPESRCCMTQSGRFYQLEGPPGMSAMVEEAWAAWARSYHLSDWRDVTAEFLSGRIELKPRFS